MPRGLQQVGKGIMFRDHQGLGKRHNAQGPLIGWARGVKVQGPPRDWAWEKCSGGLQQLGKGICAGTMHRGLSKRDNAQRPPTDCAK
jgi:hypothetical protein